MSLINDALKKAQHQRTGPLDELPPMPGAAHGPRGVKRGKTMPAQTLALIVGGITGLVILSVVITVLIVNREPAPRPTPAPQPVAAKPTPVEVASAASPIVVAPVIASPTPTVDLASQKMPAAEPVATIAESPKPVPVPVAATAAASTLTQAPAPASTPASAPVPEPPRPVAPGTQDIRILTLIDSFRVTGIRSLGSDSKVLMNDRVYRVNDMVDYTLGVRLTKVAAEGLTFVDANGTVYVKNF